jgi:hypothetical protein
MYRQHKERTASARASHADYLAKEVEHRRNTELEAAESTPQLVAESANRRTTQTLAWDRPALPLLRWGAFRRIFDTASAQTRANALGDQLGSISLGGAPGISDLLDPCCTLYRCFIRLPAALADPTYFLRWRTKFFAQLKLKFRHRKLVLERKVNREKQHR